MKLRPFVLAAVAAAAVAPAPAAAEKVCAYSVPAEMVDKLYSGTAHAGATFRFRTAADVTLDDGTPLPSGTVGWGLVRQASAAGRHAHDGSLSLEPRYLLVAGKNRRVVRVEVTMSPTLPVTWTPTEPLLQKGASHVPLPVPGIAISAINMMRWGRNITLGPGFTFSVLPVRDLTHGPIC